MRDPNQILVPPLWGEAKYFNFVPLTSFLGLFNGENHKGIFIFLHRTKNYNIFYFSQ